MNRIQSFIIAVILFITSFSYSQSFERTNEIGLFVAPGTQFLTGVNYLSPGGRNFVLAFGGFYIRPFSDHFKWKVGLSGAYEFTKNEFVNQSTKSINYTVLYMEIPAQVQYIINPSNKFQVYGGLGINLRRKFSTKSTFHSTNGDVSSTTIRNQKVAMEVLPVFLVGFNLEVNDQLTLFLQPEYRPISIEKSTNTRLRNFNAQLGFSYRL